MSVSKFDVIGLSIGWWYVGVHIGAGNLSNWALQFLTGADP